MGVVDEKPRMRIPSSSEDSRPSVSNPTGRGSYEACGRVTSRVVAGGWKCASPERPAPVRGPRRPRRPLEEGRCCGEWEFKFVILASAEGDDASDGIVWRNPNRHSIPGHHLDSEAAHSAAQLGKHLVTLVTLHAIKPATVNRHDRALHVNQIILAQLLSFQSKIVPYRRPISKLSCANAEWQPPPGRQVRRNRFPSTT